MSKCKCTQGYCCDHCWKVSAKGDPCSSPGCENPMGHTGPHGVFNNTGVIRITAADIMAALSEGDTDE